MDYTNPIEPVPPGMEIVAKITFETNHSQEFNDKIVVSIDNKEIDIPLQAVPAKPILLIDGWKNFTIFYILQNINKTTYFLKEIVDFGTLSANNKTVSSRLKITNKGATAGEFSIVYKGSLPLTFVPSQDIVPAFSHTFIRVLVC